MSSSRINETEQSGAPRAALPGVVDFFVEAKTYTEGPDVPLLPEWIDWAARQESLDEVWYTARNPELMIFMLGHAARCDYLENRAAVQDALERFVSWCVKRAGLEARQYRRPDGAVEEPSLDWFALGGSSVYSRARRAARAAEQVTVGETDTSTRAILRERTVQAAVLRLVVDSPFFRPQPVEECSVPEPTPEVECDVVVESPDDAGFDPGAEQLTSSELVLAPADRGPWGAVTRMLGPSDPPGAVGTVAQALVDADASLRHGMILLTKQMGDDWVAGAEECFREALSLLLSGVGEVHPKMAYTCDRIGLVCQIQGRDEEAEEMYLRAISLRDAGGWGHNIWDEVTLINLATLYADQGKHVLHDAMLDRLDRARRNARGSEDTKSQGA